MTHSRSVPNRRTRVRAEDSGERLSMTAPDQVRFSGVLESGAPISLHYVGGLPPKSAGFVWDIQGTAGDLRITASIGHTQMVRCRFTGDRASTTCSNRSRYPNTPATMGMGPSRSFRATWPGSTSAWPLTCAAAPGPRPHSTMPYRYTNYWQA